MRFVQIEGIALRCGPSIYLNKGIRTDVDKLASTFRPAYPYPDLLQYFMELHRNISRIIVPDHVFDGIAPNLEDQTKKKRYSDKLIRGKNYLDIRQKAMDNTGASFTHKEIKTATTARIKMSHPTDLNHANILTWMKKEKIECYRSLFEADQQMVQLEKDGIVDGIISEDGDEVAPGEKLLLTEVCRKTNGEY